MRAVILLARNSFRGRRVALVALSVLVAVGLGTGLVALIAAQRRRRVPRLPARRRRRRRRGEPEPAHRSHRRDHPHRPGGPECRHRPPHDRDGRRRWPAEVTDTPAQVKASPDGRYIRQDRPVVHEGRMIDHGAEAFLNVETAEFLDVGVGDEIPLAFWDVGRADAGIVPSDTVVEALGKRTVRVVGIGRFADEILTDELYPRLKVVVTPDVVQPYTCLSKHPDDPSATIEDLLDQLLPVECSVTFEYFSLRVAGGASGVAALIDRLTSRFDEANAQLPRALQEQDIGFYLIPAITDDERDRVERSPRPERHGAAAVRPRRGGRDPVRRGALGGPAGPPHPAGREGVVGARRHPVAADRRDRIAARGVPGRRAGGGDAAGLAVRDPGRPPAGPCPPVATGPDGRAGGQLPLAMGPTRPASRTSR